MPGLRARVKYKGISSGCSFGSHVSFTLGEPERPKDRLWAFALIDHTNPKIFDFDDDADGMESLSNLVRSGDVFGVVKGRQVQVELASVVSVIVDDSQNQDWMPMPGPEEL